MRRCAAASPLFLFAAFFSRRNFTLYRSGSETKVKRVVCAPGPVHVVRGERECRRSADDRWRRQRQSYESELQIRRAMRICQNHFANIFCIHLRSSVSPLASNERSAPRSPLAGSAAQCVSAGRGARRNALRKRRPASNSAESRVCRSAGTFRFHPISARVHGHFPLR